MRIIWDPPAIHVPLDAMLAEEPERISNTPFAPYGAWLVKPNQNNDEAT